jgi:hypothetical protein
MDTYQPIYDAVRSKMSYFDGGQLMQEIIGRFDISFYADQVKNSFQEAAWEIARPSVILKPAVSIDGNQWCVLYGENLQDGLAGFGDSLAEAMEDFDKEYNKKIK